MNPSISMRYCIMHGYNEQFQEKATMFNEHLRDGDMINDSYMHDAVRFNNLSALQILLDKGCIDPSRQNIVGNTPLHIAAYHGHTESLELLLSNGSDPSLLNERGEKALHRAVSGRRQETARMLLQRVPTDVNSPTDEGLTPLHIAAGIGDVEMAQLLLDAGADPTARTQKGRVALHYAAISGSVALMELCMDRGNSVLTVDSNGQNPRNVAFLETAIEFLDRKLAETEGPESESKEEVDLREEDNEMPTDPPSSEPSDDLC